MPLGVTVDYDRDALRRAMERTGSEVRRGTQEAVARVTEATKARARLEVAGALQSRGRRRVQNTIRSKYYADTPAGWIYSSWRPKNRPGGRADVLAAHTRAITIRPRRSTWLFIPATDLSLAERRRLRGGRVDWFSRNRIDLIPFENGPGYLVYERRRQRVVGYLVREVRTVPRLDLAQVERRAEKQLPREMVTQIERELRAGNHA